MKRPVLRVVLLYVAGIAVADWFSLPLIALLVISAVLAAVCLVFWRIRPLLLALLLVVFGAANLTLHTDVISPCDLRRLIGDRSEEVLLQGTLVRTPSQKVYERAGELSWRTIAELKVNSLRFDTAEGGWQPAFGQVTVSSPGQLSAEFLGEQQVEVAGRLHRPKEALAPGLFDYRNHLRRLGIYYQLQVASTNGWTLIETNQAHGPPLTDRFVRWAKAALARGLPVEDEALRLEWALTLGIKTSLTEEVSQPFIRAATYHIFAVDGLRIAIISGIFLKLFRLFRISRAASGLLVIPLIWFYAYLTCFPASAIRATVMASVVFCGWALRRPSDLLNSLFAAALIILLWEPSQLFQAGFQLSFCVVICIVLLMQRFQQIGTSLFVHDPWLPEEFRPRWHSLLQTSSRYVLDAFLVSLAAWLGSIPLSAYYFHILTPVSAPANLLAVPLCGLVLVCNLISLLLAGWLPVVAEFYNHAGWFLMECIRRSSHWSAEWPGAYFYVPMPDWLTMLVYYLLLLTLGTGWIFTIKRRAWALGALALLTGAWCGRLALERQTTFLTVLPLKGAAAIFVDAPGRADDLLIDCGNESSAGFVLKPFLQAQGVNRLSHLLLTCGDVNRVGGTDLIQQNFPLAEISLSSVRFRSPAYRHLLEEFESRPGLVKTVQRGDHIGRWQVLHPASGDQFPLAADNAVVLQAEVNGTRVLLLSNLGKSAQNVLFTRQSDVRAEVVVAGVPAQSEPLAEAFLAAIHPRLLIIADAEYPASARANRKLRERLSRHGIPVVYSSDVGAITLLFRRNGWEMKTGIPEQERVPEPALSADGSD